MPRINKSNNHSVNYVIFNRHNIRGKPRSRPHWPGICIRGQRPTVNQSTIDLDSASLTNEERLSRTPRRRARRQAPICERLSTLRGSVLSVCRQAALFRRDSAQLWLVACRRSRLPEAQDRNRPSVTRLADDSETIHCEPSQGILLRSKQIYERAISTLGPTANSLCHFQTVRETPLGIWNDFLHRQKSSTFSGEKSPSAT